MRKIPMSRCFARPDAFDSSVKVRSCDTRIRNSWSYQFDVDINKDHSSTCIADYILSNHFGFFIHCTGIWPQWHPILILHGSLSQFTFTSGSRTVYLHNYRRLNCTAPSEFVLSSSRLKSIDDFHNSTLTCTGCSSINWWMISLDPQLLIDWTSPSNRNTLTHVTFIYQTFIILFHWYTFTFL